MADIYVHLIYSERGQTEIKNKFRLCQPGKIKFIYIDLPVCQSLKYLMTSRLNKLIFLTGFSLVILYPASLKAQVFAKGSMTDTVKCLSYPGQSYCLYLPSFYTEMAKWPVILIFDPGGQGIRAVDLFRKAAEKHGFILACSYNSRNGPLKINFTAAGLLLDDLQKRFSIDTKRIYTAGFSGGSRVALALAATDNIISGVIGCGAGFPVDKSLYPGAKSAFVYFGIAGTRDMNYPEMFELMNFFNKIPVIQYLRTFDGGHQWPSPDIIMEAVEWLDLQAMKKKLMPIDSTYIVSCSMRIKRLTDNLMLTEKKIDAARYLRYAIRDFSGLQIAGDMTISLSNLEKSRDYREANRDWLRIAALENEKNENYVSVLEKIISSGSVPDTAVTWWKAEIGSLITMKDKGKLRNSEMASRLLNFISILCSEQGSAYYRQKQYNLSVFLFEICTLSDSENMYNHYNLAVSLSCANKKHEAIEALNKAVEHGFSSKKAVEIEPAFNTIRNEEKFKSLLTKMK